MQSVILKGLLAFSLALTALAVNAHSMAPGYTKKPALGETTEMRYELQNDYDFPAIYKVTVFEKDGETVAEGWSIDREYFKMVPGNRKSFTIKFDTLEDRKVVVCSVLHKMGYDEQDPATITRVCSRLWIWK